MFAVIGEALLDMVQPEPGGPFVAQPGGGPLNIAVGLRRLGHPTQMMARFSSGALGSMVRHHAEREHLDLDASVTTDEPTTLAFATLDERGRASYEFYVHGAADWGWTLDELAALPAGVRGVHTGSLAATMAPGSGVLVETWERLRGEGRMLLSFDPNVRPALLGAHDEAVDRVERFVSASHVVKASDEDLSWLYPGEPSTDVLDRWSTLGPQLVVITLGPRGCVACLRGGTPVEAAGRAVDVVDTIGAGDAFESGLLSAIARADRLSPDGLDELSAVDVLALIEHAIDISAFTCSRAGADPPTRADYDRGFGG